jgi:hypothetical protein
MDVGHLAGDRLHFRQRPDALHVRAHPRILTHCLDGLEAVPPSIDDHAAACLACVEAGGPESRRLADSALRASFEKRGQRLPVLRLDGEDVDQRGDFISTRIVGCIGRLLCGSLAAAFGKASATTFARLRATKTRREALISFSRVGIESSPSS